MAARVPSVGSKNLRLRRHIGRTKSNVRVFYGIVMRQHYIVVDGLRGFTATAVVCYHLISFTIPSHFPMPAERRCILRLSGFDHIQPRRRKPFVWIHNATRIRLLP
jgi:hypothetical protein